jgi:UDP-glucose 4-epimerase
MRKAVVTGGLGFIGSALVRSLLKDGWHVSAVDNMVRGKVNQFGDNEKNLTLHKIDLTQPGQLDDAFRDAQVVFHLAAVNGTSNFYKYPELVLDVGIRGMLNVVDACKKMNIRNLVVASSAEVYQNAEVIPSPEDVALQIPDVTNPRFSYAISKIASEGISMSLDDKLFDNVLVFRPHNIYGPNMGWRHVLPQLIQKAVSYKSGLSEYFEIEGDGKQTRAFCHVNDAVKGIKMIYEKGINKNIYHIGNPSEITIDELAQIICNKVEVEFSPRYSKLPLGSPTRRCPDISKIAKLGFSPLIDINSGVADAVNWYLNNLDQKPSSDLD